MTDATELAISSLGPPAGAAAGAKTPEQLRALAAQFEALLLGQMLKDMKRSMFSEDEQDGGMGSGPLADTIFAELSVALSRAGGMGLTNALMAPLLSQAGVDAQTAGLEALAAAPGAALPNVELPALALPSGLDLPASSVAAAPLAALSASLPGRLSSAYGWRQDPINGAKKFHKGVDLAMPVGQEVPAARGGAVSFAGTVDGYGLTVVVKHDDRMSTRYAHLSEILVSPGDQVAAGQTIARSGATGRVTGPHLHFEVLEDGQAVNPDGAW